MTDDVEERREEGKPSQDEGVQYEILMRNDANTVGLVSPEEEVLERYAGTRVNVDYVREALDMAEEMGWETLWVGIREGDWPVFVEHGGDHDTGALAIMPVFPEEDDD